MIQDRIAPITSQARTSWEPLVLPRFELPKGAAYAQVYVANESNVPVWFDDLRIEHWPGLLVQENHYDPFGLALVGLDQATPGLRALNQYQWNGKEKQTDFGLNWTHLDWRFFDPQTGRFHAVDPLADVGQEMWSTYQFGFNNALRYSDPDGRAPYGPGDKFKTRRAAAADFVMTYNGRSIVEHREYGTTLYSQKSQKGSQKTYSYGEPNPGTNASSNSATAIPKGSTEEGRAHTHGAYEPQYKNNEFSEYPGDKANSEKLNKVYYVGTPNGSLLEYDPSTKQTELVSDSMPSDPNDPDRRNTVPPVNFNDEEVRNSSINSLNEAGGVSTPERNKHFNTHE